MTARAFLRLSAELRESFAKAQDDETLRYLRVEVVDGDSLSAVSSRQKGDLETDFDSLAQASGESAYRAATVPHICIIVELCTCLGVEQAERRHSSVKQ